MKTIDKIRTPIWALVAVIISLLSLTNFIRRKKDIVSSDIFFILLIIIATVCLVIILIKGVLNLERKSLVQIYESFNLYCTITIMFFNVTEPSVYTNLIMPILCIGINCFLIVILVLKKVIFTQSESANRAIINLINSIFQGDKNQR